jgi:hypothetical protein
MPHTRSLSAAALFLTCVGLCQDRSVIEARLRQAKGTNAERQAVLKRMFQEAGCESLREQPVKHARVPNVICTVPGGTGGTILVGAHFDRVEGSDGVVDNWSGAALLPSLVQSIRGRPRRHTFVFTGFTDEEKGLVGSHFYARQLKRDEVAKIGAMVNIDTLGLTPTKIWASHAHPSLLNALLEWSALTGLTFSKVNVEKIGTSDSTSFRERKVPVIDFHSVTQETWPILHSSRDTLDAVQWNDYYDSYRLIAGYLAYLDRRLRPPAVQPLKATLHHVQGIDIEGDTLWVTSVDQKTRKGYLHKISLASGETTKETEVQEGDRFHPGGITLDGDSIWMPVAEYRRGGKSTIERRNKDTLELISRFEVADHVGCVAASPDALFGGNWDAVDIYSWDRQGKQLRKEPNPAGTRYQDMKFVNNRLIASGLAGKDEGRVDWLDPVSLKPSWRMFLGKTDRGVMFTNEGMTVRGGRLYLLPEDGPSRLFAFDLDN